MLCYITGKMAGGKLRMRLERKVWYPQLTSRSVVYNIQLMSGNRLVYIVNCTRRCRYKCYCIVPKQHLAFHSQHSVNALDCCSRQHMPSIVIIVYLYTILVTMHLSVLRTEKYAPNWKWLFYPHTISLWIHVLYLFWSKLRGMLIPVYVTNYIIFSPFCPRNIKINTFFLSNRCTTNTKMFRKMMVRSPY